MKCIKMGVNINIIYIERVFYISLFEINSKIICVLLCSNYYTVKLIKLTKQRHYKLNVDTDWDLLDLNKD